MNIKQSLALFAVYLLINIKNHKNCKCFAKFVGNYFDNTKANTSYDIKPIIGLKKGHYDEVFIQKK